MFYITHLSTEGREFKECLLLGMVYCLAVFGIKGTVGQRDMKLFVLFDYVVVFSHYPFHCAVQDVRDYVA